MLGSRGKTVMLVEAAPLEEGPINGEVAEDVSTRSISKPVEKRDDHYLWKVVGRGRRKRSRHIEKPAAHWQIEAGSPRVAACNADGPMCKKWRSSQEYHQSFVYW